MSDMQDFSLEPDLRTGVVPVSKAASSLAALIKRAQSERRPVAITQKGRPTGVIIDIELFGYLRELAATQEQNVSQPTE